MQRLLGQKTAACFQRCVGMDAANAVYSTTLKPTRRAAPSITRISSSSGPMCRTTTGVDGAMTDVKGDRGLSPSKQADPDLFLHVVERTADGVCHRCKGAPDRLSEQPLCSGYADHLHARG